MMRSALVIGQGSIGLRHSRVLREFGLRVGVVSRRMTEGDDVYRDPGIACAAMQPDYVVVANETSRHLETLDALVSAGHRGAVLVEKPLFLHAVPARAYPFSGLHVAYNLRFHPALQALRASLAGDRIITVQAYVGSYLPHWRPGMDYRQSSSARKAQGGGALRDLSHELDYLAWLFGSFTRLAAIGGRRGDLEIDSDDSWSVLMETRQNIMLTLQLNYLDRVPRREMTVVGVARSYRLDLTAGYLDLDSTRQSFDTERDTTYREQHRAIIEGRHDALCSYEEGLAVTAAIDAIDRSASLGSWVTQ